MNKQTFKKYRRDGEWPLAKAAQAHHAVIELTA